MSNTLKKSKERLMTYRADVAKYRQLCDELADLKRSSSVNGVDYDHILTERLAPSSPVEMRFEQIEHLESYVRKLRALLKPVARFIYILSNPNNSVSLHEMYQLVKLHYIGGCSLAEVSRRTMIHRNTLSRRNKALIHMARDYLYPSDRL